MLHVISLCLAVVGGVVCVVGGIGLFLMIGDAISGGLAFYDSKYRIYERLDALEAKHIIKEKKKK